MGFDLFPLPGWERCIYPQFGKYNEIMMLDPLMYTTELDHVKLPTCRDLARKLETGPIQHGTKQVQRIL